MASYKVYLSEPAENDIRDIIRYLSAQLSAPMTAAKMLDAIEEAIESLADLPLKYPLITDERFASLGYHKLIINHYVAFFTVDEKSKVVDVERILFMRRDWLRIL